MGWKPRTGAAANWAVFLRAVNVGGRKPLPMARLRELLADVGARDAATYIQSGNAVFAASSNDGDAIRSALEEALERELGFEVPVVLRGVDDLKAVLAANPFADSGTPDNWVHVLLSRDEPTGPLELESERFAPDECRLVGRDVFVRYPNGVARSKLTGATVSRALGGTVLTGRNVRTLARVIELAGQ